MWKPQGVSRGKLCSVGTPNRARLYRTRAKQRSKYIPRSNGSNSDANDELLNRIAQIEAENDSLKAKVEFVRSRHAEQKRDGPQAEPSDFREELAEIEQLRKENEELRRLAEEKMRVLSAHSPLGESEESSLPNLQEETLNLVSQHEIESSVDEAVISEGEVEPTKDIEEDLALDEVEEEVDELSSAKRELEEHDASKLIIDRAHWLYFTVPENPREGCDVVLYFNRMSSKILRRRPTIKALVGFNGWELGAGETYNLSPTSTRKDDFNDWWSCRFTIPKDAFEMNFVLHDNDGHFDNNSGQDYTRDVSSNMSAAEWHASSQEREAQMEKQLIEREKRELEENERRRAQEIQDKERQQAVDAVNRARNNKSKLQEIAVSSISRENQVAICTKPAKLRGGDKAILIYNTSHGPLQGSKSISVVLGYNDWTSQRTLEMVRQTSFAEGDIWHVDIDVPLEALVLNFVVKNEKDQYDNNSKHNFNLIVEVPDNGDDYWDELILKLQTQLKEERIAKEKEDEERSKKREERKSKVKAYARKVARRKLAHILYTEPSEVRAGSEVTLFYNTMNTPLKNKGNLVSIKRGFNRWSYEEDFPLQQMEPVQGKNGWMKTKIDIPSDAYMMDFVFAGGHDGKGEYDNNQGMDYHLNIIGGPPSPPLYICHVAVEMAPIAKVGGLGDVVTALARAVQEHGHHSEIIMPRYDFLLASPLLQETTFETEIDWGGCKNYVTTCIVEGVRVFFIEPSNGMFKVGSVYSTQGNDSMKFDFFSKVALEFLLQSGRQPDILHCHDWSSATVASSYWLDYHQYGLWKPKVIFTIHNLDFGADKIGEAAMHSQRFTTVSPSYAYEVGDHPSINPHVEKFSGIINGIDTDIWDPMDDKFIPIPYGPENHIEGKAAAKDALRDRLNLRKDRTCPVIGVVSRLTAQKGIHLIKHTAFRTLERGGQFVLLGSAPDPKIQAEFNDLASSLGGDMAGFCYKYDEPLSHLIYAGCDLIVVPSMFEPCGLTQMISMRYGAVPVVRQTGGLKDTVFDVDHDKGRAAWEIHGATDWTEENAEGTNGFSFEGTDEESLDYALNRAIDSWYDDRKWFHELQKRDMEQDWSWNKPALDYLELYYSAIKG